MEKEILLNRFKSKEQADVDFYVPIILNSNEQLVNECIIEQKVNVSDLFEDERNISTCYRFLGNSNILASNVLFNYNEGVSYQSIIELRDFDDETEEYVFEQNEVLNEENGWFYVLSGSTNCEKTFLEPIPSKFSPYDGRGVDNWNLYLTYPFSIDEQVLEFNGVNINDGISIVSGYSVTIEDRSMTVLISAINHGLESDSLINFDSTNQTIFDGSHEVYQIGDEVGVNTNNAFILDVNLTIPDFINSESRIKKVIEGIESQYYSRWFRKITKVGSFEFYNTAFAQNYFSDQLYSYRFTNDIDVSLYSDYKNRPLTDLYLTFIKRDLLENGQQFWTPVQSGIKNDYLDSNYNIQLVNSLPSATKVEDNVNTSTDLFFGDIVEFNVITQEEIVLHEAYHRFNTRNREENNFLEGYYYKAHQKTSIKQYADYVNITFSGDTEVPEYADFLDDARAIWRDVIPNSNNGENIPFLNNCHYIYDNVNLYVRRQDPCAELDLPLDNFVLGICDKNEQFTEVEINEICN